MKNITLETLGDNYEVISPIVVEVAVSNGCDGKLVWLTVQNLQNELIFGVGRTIDSAMEMLKEVLTTYYENLMSSDLNKFDSIERYRLDKQKLSRSINARTT